MSICHSCGGVIGRDCFNPSECEWISHQMEMDAHQHAQMQDSHIESLHGQVKKLTSALRETYRVLMESH